MRLILAVTMILLTGCATESKKEYEYMLNTGESASPEQVIAVKKHCRYDENIQLVSEYMGMAISVGRYESQFGSKASAGYINKASELMTQVTQCLHDNGLSTREKPVHG